MIDGFDDNNMHFFYITFNKIETDLCYKPTHTGHYSDITPYRNGDYLI